MDISANKKNYTHTNLKVLQPTLIFFSVAHAETQESKE